MCLEVGCCYCSRFVRVLFLPELKLMEITQWEDGEPAIRGRACDLSFVFTTKPHQVTHMLLFLAQPFGLGAHSTGLKEASLGHTTTGTLLSQT